MARKEWRESIQKRLQDEPTAKMVSNQWPPEGQHSEAIEDASAFARLVQWDVAAGIALTTAFWRALRNVCDPDESGKFLAIVVPLLDGWKHYEELLAWHNAEFVPTPNNDEKGGSTMQQLPGGGGGGGGGGPRESEPHADSGGGGR